MKKFVKKLILLFISIQFAACEGNLEPHLYGVVDTGNAFSTPADLSAATVALYYELRQKGWGPYLFCDGSSFVMDEVSTDYQMVMGCFSEWHVDGCRSDGERIL